MNASATRPSEKPVLGGGPGRLIVALYGLMALAATGRSLLQIAVDFGRAPLAYSLSAFAAVVYIGATIALAKGGSWTITAWAAVVIELLGVYAVGTWSYVQAEMFPDKTVWSHFGSGYGYLPAILPVIGLWWLWHNHRAA